MPNQTAELAPEKLREEISEMIEALTHPEFVKAMRKVRAAPYEKRLVEGSRQLTPEILRRKGVPLPKDMRISSRYFEEDFPAPIDFGELPKGRPNIVNVLNEVQPGLLDRLRTENPQVYKELVSVGWDQVVLAGGGGCCCGGGATVCGGCGGDTAVA